LRLSMKFQPLPAFKFTLSTVMLLGLALSCFAPACLAQEVTNRTVGVSGDMDYRDRSPDLGVTVVPHSDRVQILADAHVPNEKYAKYPLQFDFYVNRRLFSSQMRTTELPGAVGIDVSPDVATTPFNYTVIARVITPNGRYFTTVLQGAVFASNLLTTLDCTVLLGGIDGVEYVSNSVSTTQRSNEGFALTFRANPINDEGGSLEVDTSLALTGDGMVAGMIATAPTANSSALLSRNVSGTVDLDSGGNLESFDVQSDDGALTLRCS